jgi:hypothetical protein
MIGPPAATKRLIAEGLCGAFAEETDVIERNGETVVLLPFTDHSGDSVEVMLRRHSAGSILLTDSGHVFQELAAGIGGSKPEHDTWVHVQEIANRYAVGWEGGNLFATVASDEALGEAVMALGWSIAEALGLERTHVQPPQIQFSEEIGMFLEENRIPFRAKQAIEGMSNAAHVVDFVLENGRPHVVQAIASDSAMRRSLNMFYDLVERDPEILPVAFIDEEKQGYSNRAFQQLSYKAQVFLWGQRSQFLQYWRRATHH